MEFVSGNIFIREMCFEKAGEIIKGHAHNFDHTTYVIHGSIKIDRDGDIIIKKSSERKNWILIKAGVKHIITALENDTIAHCIYSHRTPQGEIVQEYDGWMKAME